MVSFIICSISFLEFEFCPSIFMLNAKGSVTWLVIHNVHVEHFAYVEFLEVNHAITVHGYVEGVQILFPMDHQYYNVIDGIQRLIAYHCH